ncbi:MAG: penicillin-binding protein activator, partial [Rhodobacteraceae bacterium]|nr:penicillin-binding protein activator [Paracoccaceae bacterium]
NTDRPVQVALLVPGGSGQSGDSVLAESLEKAARLAISDLQGARIDLRVYNTGGQPAQAAQVAVAAVGDGARVILGPVFGEAANAAGVAVAPRNVNVLSFSNNTAIAGGNVFVLGPTFDNTASRLVRYAAAQGRDRILVVHDQTTAGEAGRRAIERAIARSGLRPAGFASYEFSQQGIIAAVGGIADQAKASGANAIFFTADTAGALPLLTQLLADQGVGPDVVQYIGLTRWDIPQSTLALPGVQGGWFALPDPGLGQQFAARYRAAYGTAPHPIAGLAYDGIAAIGALVRAGRGDALTKDALTQPSGFVGVNGIFRLDRDGTNQRGLAIAQIIDKQVNVIDPAPRSFDATGF